MKASNRLALKAGGAAALVLALTWLATNVMRARRPYTFDESALSGWTLVKGAPGEAALVALRPPARFSESLTEQLSQRVPEPLATPERPMVPLVLRDEYSESLQGVLSVDDIMNVAREVGLDSSRFEPICIGHRRDPDGDQPRHLYFVVFESPYFNQFRQQLTPLFPEHAGSGTYDPAGLRPTLALAGTDREFGRWWPLRFEADQDCEFALTSE